MTYRYTIIFMIYTQPPLYPMNMTPQSTAQLKTLLDQQPDAEKVMPDALIYKALKNSSHAIESFLDEHPEYAQQIVDLITQKMCHADIEPWEKTIIRLIHHQNLFLGYRTQDELDHILDDINPQNKNL